jgi:hypothetical protein
MRRFLPAALALAASAACTALPAPDVQAPPPAAGAPSAPPAAAEAPSAGAGVRGAPAAALDTVQLPFAVNLRSYVIPHMPALQGFVQGQDGGRWLLLQGRREGLHTLLDTLGNAFPPSLANDSVYVVDPRTRQVWSAPVSGLPLPLADALRVTNAAGYQDGDWLYLVGGYGRDTPTDSMITFRTVTAVNVPQVIAAVTAGRPLSPDHFQQVRNFALNVTGGGLLKLDGIFYLVMGQRFDGLYATDPGAYDQFIQEYKESIQRVRITPSPLSVAVIDTIAQDPNDFSRPFHRRDLIAAGAYAPDGTRRVAVYGGVFVPGQMAAYRNPVYVQGSTATVDRSFFQAMSQYDCAALPLFDRAGRQMHTVLFGGISQYSYSADSGTVTSSPDLPFIDDVSVITVSDQGTRQVVYPWEMPARIGADARFIMDPAVASDPELDVVFLDALPDGNSVRVGWMYGGIVSDVPVTSDQRTQTRPNGTVYEIWVTRWPAPAISLPTANAGHE